MTTEGRVGPCSAKESKQNFCEMFSDMMRNIGCSSSQVGPTRNGEVQFTTAQSAKSTIVLYCTYLGNKCGPSSFSNSHRYVIIGKLRDCTSGINTLVLASHRGGPGLVMWDLWWTKWRWGRFSPSTSVSPANLHSINCSTITLIYHLELVQ
jgi:hypothetical protein